MCTLSSDYGWWGESFEFIKMGEGEKYVHIPHTQVGVESQSIVETHFVCAVNMRIKLLPSYILKRYTVLI